MSVTVRLTEGVDSLIGSNGDDIVEFPAGILNAQPEDQVSLGAGFDSIITERTSPLGLGLDRLSGFTGADLIDVSSTESATLTAYEFLLDQSDNGTFTIRFDGDPLSLNMRNMAGRDGLILDGTGDITLADVDRQWITLTDGTTGIVLGGNGIDIIEGAGGNNTFFGGTGTDVLSGGADNDSLTGADGSDDLSGGTGDDILDGGADADALLGGSGMNTVSGGEGSDTFVVTLGETLTITDFDATDAYEFIDVRDLGADLDLGLTATDDGTFKAFDLGGGTTLRLTEAAADQIDASHFIAPTNADFISLAQGLATPADARFTSATDAFTGGAGSQIFEIIGNYSKLSGADVFAGGDDQDVLRIWGDNRSLSEPLVQGMSGIDVFDLMAATGNIGMSISSSMLAQSDNGTLLVKHGASTMIIDAPFETGAITVEGTGEVTLRNTAFQDVTISDGYDGFVTGGSRADKITGGARDDRINGGLMDDTLDGAGGDDIIYGDGGNDTLFAGDGADTLFGGDGDDELIANGGSAVMTGGEGDDIFVIQKNAGPVTITDLDTASFLERVDLSQIDTIRKPSDIKVSISGRDVRLQADGLDVTLAGAAGPDLDIRDAVLPGQNAKIFNVDTNTPIEELQSLIHGSAAGTVINLAAGTYDIDQTLWVDRSDITIQGAGEGETILRMAQDNENAGQVILVQPDGQELFENLSSLAVTSAAGSHQITLSQDHNLSVGDLLFVHQANDDEWLAETGNSDWNEPTLPRAEDTFLREFRSRITEVDGNTITLSEALPFTFEAGVATARQSTYLKNVVLSDFTVTGQWGETADPFDFSNTLDDAWKSVAAIEIDAVEQSSISNVSVIDVASHAYRFQRTYDVTGDDLYAEGAHNKGPSNGYHYYFVEAFNTDITDATSVDARHSVLFSSFHAEHYNSIEVTQTNRDINFHGSPDADNVVTVLSMIQDYPLGVFPQWQAVNPGVPIEHPEATIDANDVTFTYLEAGERPDIVTASDAGAVLNTGIGSDQLFGGDGDDILRGGLNDDDMTGGGGQDRFIYAVGDGNDQIRDFEFGRNGDVLVLEGTALTNLSQLEYSFEGRDLVVSLGLDASVRLVNATGAGQAHPNNVAFVDNPDVDGIVDKANPDEFYILGTQADDTFTISRQHIDSPDFAATTGAGLDTLVVEVANVDQTVEEIGAFSGIDVFDFSISTLGNLALKIGSQVVDQSDNGQIVTKIGDTGDMRLDLSGVADASDVIIDGARLINLSDAGNSLTLGDRVGADVNGGDQDDTVIGGTQADIIRGGAGDDWISGGAGEDVLTGGAGADDFVFDVLGSAQQGADRITDFTSGSDRILLDVPDGAFPTGALPRGVLWEGQQAVDSNDYLLYDQGTGSLWVDLNPSTPDGQILIATLDGNLALDSGDFFLI